MVFAPHKEEIRFNRDIYDGLDLIGDLGGLYDGLNIICFVIIFFWNNFNFVTVLTSKIYSISNPSLIGGRGSPESRTHGNDKGQKDDIGEADQSDLSGENFKNKR